MTKTFKKTPVRKIVASAAILAIAGASVPGAAIAQETNQVRFAQQFGLLYLPMHVVVEKKMVQACASKAGLGDIKVTMHRFSGGAAVNQALLSDSVDFAAGGIGPLLKLWDKTKKTVAFVTHSIPEAVFLSTRIVVMSPRPGRIHDIIETTLPRDRTLDIRETPEFLELSHRVREGLREGHSYDQ